MLSNEGADILMGEQARPTLLKQDRSARPMVPRIVVEHPAITTYIEQQGISPQSCTETDFEMKTSNFVLFLLISVVSVHFRAIYDETIRCQA